MKKIFLLVLILCGMAQAGGIVNNTGSTAADSLPISFVNLDENGNVSTTALTTADSIIIIVNDPSGTQIKNVAYPPASAIFQNNSPTNRNLGLYTLKTRVDTLLSGTTARNGVYSYIILVKDSTVG